MADPSSSGSTQPTMASWRARCAIALLCCSALVLAGCSDSDADDAQAKVEQANSELVDAQVQLEQAQQAKAEADAAKEKTQADREIAEATSRKEQAQQKQAAASQKSDAATQQARDENREQAQADEQPVCADCGTVSSITPVTRNAEGGSGVGAVAGGVAGAVVGSQIGSGSGKTIAQIAGTLGGAFAGNEVEKRVRKVTTYQVNVAMDAGGSRSVSVDDANAISTGTRVQVQGNNLVLMR